MNVAPWWLIAVKQRAPPILGDIQAVEGFIFAVDEAPVSTHLLKELKPRQIMHLNVCVVGEPGLVSHTFVFLPTDVTSRLMETKHLHARRRDERCTGALARAR